MENPYFSNRRIIRLPPGFRFYPTDEELLVHYLKRKVQSLPLPDSIPEGDVCKCDPWSLPGDPMQERYFLSNIAVKYPNGKRSNRATLLGFWKASGIKKQIVDTRNKEVVGTKKTLVFYIGKPPKVSKTDWIMHEYKLSNPTQGIENWVICRMFLKKRGKKVGSSLKKFMSGPKKFDLNLDGGDSISSCSSVVTIVGDEYEDEETSK